MRGWKKIFHATGNDKNVGVAMLISGNIDFKTKAGKKGKEGHYITINGSIQGEDYIYAPNIEAPKCMKQILTDIKGEIDGNAVTTHSH